MQSKKITVYSHLGEILYYFNSSQEASRFFNISEAVIRTICRKEQQFLYKDKVRYIIRYSEYKMTIAEIEFINTLNYSTVVKRYNLNGELLDTFASCKEAAETLKIQQYNVQQCCSRNSKYTTINNIKFIFRYGDDLVSVEDLNKIKKEIYKIKAINYKTQEVIGIYDSYSEASLALNVAIGSISSCCKGKLKSAGKVNGIKIIWQYVA